MWGERPGEASPIVDRPFQLDREVKARRGNEDNRAALLATDASLKKIDQTEQL